MRPAVSSEVIATVERVTLAMIQDRAVISVEQAASVLGIGRTAAYNAVRTQQIPSVRVGRRVLIPVPALMAWLGFEAAAEETPADHTG